MLTRLGLDMGTNSIGWCLVEYSDENPIGQRIVDKGVRIFSDGRDPKSGASLAVDRREARGARRRRDRYLGRRSAFLHCLVQYGLMPDDQAEAKLIAEQDPYDLRRRALYEVLKPYEIGRILFHLNQRRGFKSNRKAERKADDGGKIHIGASKLDEAMAEAGAQTLGEFLAMRLDAGKDTRVRMSGESQDYDFYPQRRHIEQEFAAIWDKQRAHHPDVLTEEARQALARILFFQRPLKAQEIGVCTFVSDEKRLAKAHPLFQERRLYEEVNQLEITTPGAAQRKLTPDERDKLIAKLRTVKASSFSALGKLLHLDTGQSFNKASETRTKLLGDEVYAAMSDKKLFDNRWAHFPMEERWTIIDKLLHEEDPDRLHGFLRDEYGLDDDQIAQAEKATRSLPEGYGRLGPTATARILAELKTGLNDDGKVITYNEAVERCGWNHSDFRTGEILPELPYYGELLTREIPPGTQDPKDPEEKRWGKITNPTVHIGLRQLQKLVNQIIKTHGRPTQIVVELARELKLNDKQKEEHRKRIGKNTKAAEARSAKLLSMGQRDTGANRMLLRLWEDLAPDSVLNRHCPYCGEKISAEDLFNGRADVDHILPYSRTLDDSVGNKTIAHGHCNKAKGNRTPWEAWGGTESWDIIAEQASRLHKSKQWRFGPDAMEQAEKDGGFLARQLTDTQYLSRMTRTYLTSLYPGEESSVYVIPGQMTAMLRRLWGLNDILWDHNYTENKHSNAPKNRLDHRHHTIDAAVVAVTTRRMLQEIAKNAARSEANNLDRLFEDLPPPWESFRDDLRTALAQVVVSHKQDHGSSRKALKDPQKTAAQLHNETAYGITSNVNEKGDTIVRYRVSLEGLTRKDIEKEDRISDPLLRRALLYATQGLEGAAYKKALSDFPKQPGPYAGIRRVRVRRPLKVIPIRDKHGKPYKGYQGDSNARYDVWRLPDGKWVADVISTFDIHQADFDEQVRRPHPAAKRVLSLRQNDVIAVEKDGERKFMRIQKYGQNGQIFLIEHSETGDMVQRNKDPNDPFKFYGPAASTLQKMKARQIRIDPLGRVFDPGPRA